MHSETPPPSTKSWLKAKLQTIKRVIGFHFSDEVLISILVCLISREKHLILICKQENMEELRNMTEQAKSQTIAEFTSSLFINKARDENLYLLSNDAPEEITIKTQKSSRSLRTVDSNKSNDKKLTVTSTAHDLARTKRRSNMSYNSSNPKDLLNTESNTLEYSQAGSSGIIGGGDESMGSNTLYPDSGDNNSQKHRERSRLYDGPKESNISFNRSSSLKTSRRKNTAISSTSIKQQPNDNSNTSEKMSSTLLLSIRPKLSVSTGQSRKNTQPINHQPHISPSPTQTPNTPSDYTFSKKKHESLSTAGIFDPPSPYFSNSRKLAHAVIIESLTEANETIHALLMEILVKKQVVDRSSVCGLPKPFIIVALLPITDSNSYDIPRQLLDRFFISYTYESVIGIPSGGGRSPMNVNRHNVIVHNDMERYIRDVVVGIRTHRLVKGGVTARSYLDFVTLIKALAAILQHHYVTPKLVLFASEKVFCHRLILRDIKDDKSIMYGTSITTLMRRRKLLSKVLTSGDIVADVLQCVWPPV
ncbi:10366_t:CDS:2 [Entrophospora sp. SA101]|nr:10366_t:CDS:2 [Entrophospora sp. SA101]